MRTLSVVLLGILCASPGFAASFDCSRATTLNEKAICASPRLSQLDDRLSAAYGKLLTAVPAEVRTMVRTSERNWLHSVGDGCPANVGLEALGDCLAPKWDKRVSSIETTLSSIELHDAAPLLWSSVHLTQADTGDLASFDARRGALMYSTLDVEWPQALSTDPNWQAWNRAVELEAHMMVSDGDAKPGDPWAAIEGTDNDVSVTLGDITPVFVGASFQNLWYGHGAAHSNYAKLQLNWLLLERRELVAEDVFRSNSDWRKFLYSRAMESLKVQIDPTFPESHWIPGYGEDGVRKMVADPHNWILDKTGLTLDFQDSISCHACGEFKVELSWEELKPMLQSKFRM